MNEWDACSEYALNVVNGAIDACEYVRKVCQAHLTLLKECRAGLHNGVYRYNEKQTARFLEYSREIRHFEGDERLIGKRVKWLPWQIFFFGNVYGWQKYNPDLGIWTWKHKEIYLEVPKKNGKSFICSAISLYDCGFILPSGAKVFLIAADGGQVKLTFEPAIHFVQDSECLSEIFQPVGTRIYFNRDRSSFIQALPKQKENADGKNALTVIADELHAHDDGGAFYRRMMRGVSARSNYHIIAITTAGLDKHSFCKKHRDSFLPLIDGVQKDDSKFALIYTTDKSDDLDFDDERIWRKTNPSFGESKTREYFERQIANIRVKPSEKNEFLAKDLNIWVDNVEAWLDSEKLDSAFQEFDVEKLKGKRCFLGVDLARKRDLSAVVAVFPKQEGLEKTVCWAHCFINADTIESREENSKVPFREWAERGWVHVTEGDEINFEEIQDFILEFAQSYKVEALYYDPTFAQMMMATLKSRGINTKEFIQNGKNYSDVVNSFEIGVNTDAIIFIANECFKWCLYNIEIQKFNDKRVMPYKKGDENKKIDAGIACLMAYKGVITKTDEEKKNSAEAYLIANGYVKNAEGKWVKSTATEKN